MVEGSARSPAKNCILKFLRLYFFISSPLGSSRLIALRAVGAVNITETLYSLITLQNEPESGVPVGLPSYNIEVQPDKSGAYTIYE